MDSTYAKEKEVAISAVLQGYALAEKMQRALLSKDVVDKEDHSPVTLADYCLQALINQEIKKVFPEDGIVAEEDVAYLRQPKQRSIKEKVVDEMRILFPNLTEQAILETIDCQGCEGGAKGRFWILDPIDGTRGFIHQEAYAIALALIVDGQVVLGVLGCPLFPIPGLCTGALLVAVRGEGTTLISIPDKKERLMRVGKSSEIIYCEPHSASQTHWHIKAYEIAQQVGVNPKPFRMDSQCKYAHVASGDAAIYLRIPTRKAQSEKIWDHAAGAIIVEEAGGKVTDLFGHPLDFSCGSTLVHNTGIVATNGFLHEQVLAAIKKSL